MVREGINAAKTAPLTTRTTLNSDYSVPAGKARRHIE
jgi:hypothetical protein